jgi:glycosyltransferase involved in cell wall biosynthesis
LVRQATKKQKIVLCMIVKNEAKVIERCFDSLRSIVDEYVVCDTGSTDGTQEVMKKYWKKHKLKGEVHNRPWVSFCHNRQEAFDLGKGKGDYIMTIDADEVFAPFVNNKVDLNKKVAALPTLKADRVEVKTQYGNLLYSRTQFYKNGLDWKWNWPIHEVCGAADEKSMETLFNACVYPTSEGARSTDPHKYQRDALVFEQWLLDHPEDARGWFYLAQSYRDCGQPAKSLEPLKKCIEYSQWDEETYLAKLRMGRCKIEAGIPWQECINDFLQAYEFRPSRAEALYEIIHRYRVSENFVLAILLGEIAIQLPYPTHDRLFVEPNVYHWRLADELGVAYYWTGRYEESIAVIKKALDNSEANIGDESRERMLKNIRYAEEALNEQKTKS